MYSITTTNPYSVGLLLVTSSHGHRTMYSVTKQSLQCRLAVGTSSHGHKTVYSITTTNPYSVG